MHLKIRVKLWKSITSCHINQDNHKGLAAFACRIWNYSYLQRKYLLATMKFCPSSPQFVWLTTIWQEEFEDTKGVIRIRKSKKERQHNGQEKKDKCTNNDLQNITHKTKNPLIRTSLKSGGELGFSGGDKQFLLHMCHLLWYSTFV